MVTLRDYQHKLIADIDSAVQAGASAPAAVLPTGGGKTTVFGRMSQSEVEAGGSVVVLAHRRELITQAADRLHLFGLDPARVMPGGKGGDGRSFVASVQTLQNRLGEIPEPSLLVVDECHHAPAGQWAAIRAAWPNARYVGFTATPVRTDGRGLREAFDALVLGPSVRWLTDRGFLVPAETFAPSIPDLTRVRTRYGEYDPADLAEALERSRVYGDAPAHWRRAYPNGARGIAFCATLAHAHKMAHRYTDAGIRCAVLTGSDKTAHRDATLGALDAGDIELVLNVGIISEGFDLPNLDAVVWLTATTSEGKWLQGCGRPVRAAPGKTGAAIFDHAGNAWRHGLYIQDRTWTLDGKKARPRSHTHTEDGQDLSLVRCGHCFHMHETAPVCPRCGTAHEKDERIPAFRAAELRAISEKEAREAKEAAKAAAAAARKAEESGCRTLDDWIALGKKRGYDPAWAYTRHNLRLKRAPARPMLRFDGEGWPV